jgi:SAM-dependent methyltransferase
MQFDFGQNWADYSAHAITRERLAQARADFARLMTGVELDGRSFLDIGFGQGFVLLTATVLGARIVGCDINPKCEEVLARNQQLFPELSGQKLDVVIGSILEEATLERLKAHPNYGVNGFDIVHSWGVLHHTGNMRQGIANAASLVRPGGTLVIAIYNRHWSSLPWRGIKWAYCKSPRWAQNIMIATLYPVIWFAKLLVTRGNPAVKERGMDFYYDVVDWVGGYPYEYATFEEMQEMCRPLGLTLVQSHPANVPTGCNELIFKRTA